MKYFFVTDTQGKRHIIVAESAERATVIAENGGLDIVNLYKLLPYTLDIMNLYELLPDTFDSPGFLISDK